MTQPTTHESTFDPIPAQELMPAKVRRALIPFHDQAIAACARKQPDLALARTINADALAEVLNDLSPVAAERAKRTILHLRELARTGEAV